MKLEVSHEFKAPRERVWAVFNDPAVLARVTPGLQQLEVVGPDEYRARLSVGVAAVKGTYQGKLAIVDKKPPESYTLQIEGNGRGGFVKGTGHIVLTESDGGTKATIQGDAQVGGLIAAVGQRLIESAARMMMAQFLAAMDAEVARSGGDGGSAPPAG
jgi:carbon monoxide dehydrogenase subunit G